MANSNLRKYGPGLLGAGVGFSFFGVSADVANDCLNHSYKTAALKGGLAGGGLMLFALVFWLILKKLDEKANATNSPQRTLLDSDKEPSLSGESYESAMAKDFKLSMLVVLAIAAVMSVLLAGFCVAAYYCGPLPTMYVGG